MKTDARAVFWALTVALVALLAAPLAATAADEEKPLAQILITNVNVWDGTSDGLEKADVLVEGNLIKQVGAGIRAPAGAEVIDGGGRTLIPGLIDMHSHLSIMEGMLDGRDAFDQMAIGAMTGNVMRSYLDQGFTTTMELGGNVLGVAKAVNLGKARGLESSRPAGSSPRRVATVTPGDSTMSWVRPTDSQRSISPTSLTAGPRSCKPPGTIFARVRRRSSSWVAVA